MIHRIIMYVSGCVVIIAACTWLALDDAAARNQTHQVLARIVPTTIEDYMVFPTNHVVIPLLATQEYRWDTITLDPSIPLGEYYAELWDADNHIIPGFASQRLYEHTLDISSIDASLTPSLRLVLFKPEAAPEFPPQYAVQVSYAEYPNVRLAVVLAVTGLLYWTLLLLALSQLSHWRTLGTDTIKVLRGQAVSTLSAALMVVVFAGWFGIILGLNIGGIQIAYVLLKLPLLLLVALLVSFSTLAMLTILAGINTGPVKLWHIAMNLLATTALGLASLSPVLLFYILYPLKHDAVLVAAVTFFGISGLLAMLALYRWLVHNGAKLFSRFIIPLLWLGVYGIVLMQLGWLLRPWVGVIDPVHETVPFARPNSGNVFVELTRTIERL